MTNPWPGVWLHYHTLIVSFTLLDTRWFPPGIVRLAPGSSPLWGMKLFSLLRTLVSGICICEALPSKSVWAWLAHENRIFIDKWMHRNPPGIIKLIDTIWLPLCIHQTNIIQVVQHMIWHYCSRPQRPSAKPSYSGLDIIEVVPVKGWIHWGKSVRSDARSQC